MKLFFLVQNVDGKVIFHHVSLTLQGVIDYIKSHKDENYRIYISSDFLDVRFLDNKIFID